MTEQIADAGRGISFAYEELGDSGADPLVLVAGPGQQLHDHAHRRRPAAPTITP
jgi:hypothetical protein